MEPVPSEVRNKYIEIIDNILSNANLAEVTEKRIRNGIQERVEYDITPQKVRKESACVCVWCVDSKRRLSKP